MFRVVVVTHSGERLPSAFTIETTGRSGLSRRLLPPMGVLPIGST